MSKAGIDFMGDRVEHDIAASSSSRQSGERLEYHVAACVEEAARKGIGRQEIEEDIGEYIREAMHDAAAGELHGDAARDE